LGVRLTKRQDEIYQFIREQIEREGAPPTIMEIAGKFGFTSPTSVVDHLKALERKGYLRRIGHRSRGIELVNRSGGRLVPVIGRVAAGYPVLAEENVEGLLTMDAGLVGEDRTYALKVSGDSMIGAGVLDGDYVFVRPGQEAKTGDMVVALIDGEVTVKSYHPIRKGVRLQPANPAYKCIILRSKKELQAAIIGVVTGIYRRI